MEFSPDPAPCNYREDDDDDDNGNTAPKRPVDARAPSILLTTLVMSIVAATTAHAQETSATSADSIFPPSTLSRVTVIPAPTASTSLATTLKTAPSSTSSRLSTALNLSSPTSSPSGSSGSDVISLGAAAGIGLGLGLGILIGTGVLSCAVVHYRKKRALEEGDDELTGMGDSRVGGSDMGTRGRKL